MESQKELEFAIFCIENVALRSIENVALRSSWTH